MLPKGTIPIAIGTFFVGVLCLVAIAGCVALLERTDEMKARVIAGIVTDTDAAERLEGVGRVRVEGTVTNTNYAMGVRFVRLKITWYDADENVVDITDTFAVGRETLEPGETSRWNDSSSAVNAEYVSVEVYDLRLAANRELRRR